MKSKTKYNILIIATAVVAALLITVNILMFGVFGQVLDAYFATGKASASAELTAEEAKAASEAVCEDAVGEGAVLLKNSGNALPLSGNNKKVNVFGYRSTDICYGGSGSGSASTEENVTFLNGLERAGFEVNPALTEFYGGDGTSGGSGSVGSTDFSIKEKPLAEYTGDVAMSELKKFSDTAIVVFGRNGGEGNDLPRSMADYGGTADKHYLELSDEESALLGALKDNFGAVVVIINSSNAMELGFIEDDGVDACLWIGHPGSTGCIAVGNILAGNISPSGRTADIYAADALSSPAVKNVAPLKYSNTDGYTIEYAEGIYVGYRWYETMAAEMNEQTPDSGDAWYDEQVVYPFGYGLSYAEFTQSLAEGGTADGTTISGTDTVTVNVKTERASDDAFEGNAKEVVQVYFTPPYEDGGVEKSEVALVAFDKVELAKGGEIVSELSFSAEEMASYDVSANDGKGAYVLEAGDYEISLRSDSHTVIDSFTVTVASDVVYSGDGKRASDEQAAVNLFADAAGDVEYLSRENAFANFDTATDGPSATAAQSVIGDLSENGLSDYDDSGYAGGEPVVGADNGLAIADLAKADYDDERWDKLIAQMSVREMQNLIGFGGYATQKVASIQKDRTLDTDGPAGLSYYMNQDNYDCASYCTEVVFASSWNDELAKKFGNAVGDEANAWGFNGWYAPACNTHRTPFGGRNFEYFSEDPLLGGKMTANVAAGAREKGIVTYVKHFALNDQEDHRVEMVCTWANEQSMREIYLKPFEIAVKEGDTLGMMTSYNFIGSTWTGGSYELCTEVLRNEWGFVGVVITDYGYGSYNYMDPDVAIRAGNDMMLSTLGLAPTDTSSAGIAAMQKAVKNILYSVAHSSAGAQEYVGGMESWRIVMIVVDIVVGLLIVAGVAFFVMGKLKAKKVQTEA